MKHNLFTLSVMSAGLFGMSLQAQNLISDGDMTSKASWSESYLNTNETDYPSVSWGYNSDKPSASQGDVLYFIKENPFGTSQYCIYKEVELQNTESYAFDASYKVLQMSECWFEIFIDKNAPIEGEDYSGNKIAGFNVWWNSGVMDGVFSENAIEYSHFTPQESGKYFLVIKCGANAGGKYEMLVDDISLSVVEKPSTKFTTNKIEGMTPLSVEFTSENFKVTEWSWDFGDGVTSTEENPVHIYNNPGTYSVKLTASNTSGEVVVEKENLIIVHNAVILNAGGVVKGGDMADVNKWNECDLTTPTGKLPVVIWNETSKIPSAGKNGALYIEGEANESNTVQYCIYQTVNLESGMVYKFDAAIKDFTQGLDHCFIEVFISDEEPMNGMDYGSNQGVLIANFSTWDARNVLPGLDCTFGLSGNVYPYISSLSSDKILTIKIGTTDWENKQFPFKIAIDEISFTAERTKPYPEFRTENNQGFAPLDVTFENITRFGNSYVWDFGDGTTEETDDIFINHIYAKTGTYNVSLKAINEKGDSTILMESCVIVADKPVLTDGEKLYGGEMENRALWYIADVNAAVKPTMTWNYTEALPSSGSGGALRLQATVQNQGSNIALYQPITLNKDSVYIFDCDFRDLGENADHFWAQAYISDVKPEDYSDPYNEDDCIGQLNTWKEGHNPNNYDGSFKDLAIKGNNHKQDVCEYQPQESGQYYFILKVGNTDWENTVYTYDVLFDNLSLKGSIPVEKPIADFMIISDEQGDAPFVVDFFNLSLNADSYLWDFGDGATSTEENPSHTYNIPGIYTITLNAIKGSYSHFVKYEDYVTVTGINSINSPEMSGLEIVTEVSFIKIKGAKNSISIYNSNGILIENRCIKSDVFVSGKLSRGIYIVVIDGMIVKVSI